jgi:hypothetical protein
MVENTNSTILEVQGSFGLNYMVGIIPLNLRSQETVKGVPHVRARRRRPGRARRGVACGERAWRDPSPSASLRERLSRGEPLALDTRTEPFQSHSPALIESIPIS